MATTSGQGAREATRHPAVLASARNPLPKARQPMDEIKVGCAVRLRGGGPTMTVLRPHTRPPEFPAVTDLGPQWEPDCWELCWFVQNAIRFATLPAAALMLVRDG